MKRKLGLAILLIILLYPLLWFMKLTPIVIDLTGDDPSTHNPVLGDTIQPLGGFDFDKGTWQMYFIYSISDLYNSDNLLKGKAFVCKDQAVMKSMQKSMHSIFRGSDMATVDSWFFLFQDGTLKLKCNAEVSKNVCGLQSSKFGWVENMETCSFFSHFSPINWPVLVLR